MSGLNSAGTGARSSVLGRSIGSPELTSDTMGWLYKAYSSFAGAVGGNVVVGMVIRSGGGSYDCTVRIGTRDIGCTILQPVCTATFGFASGFVPIEGTKVVVLLVDKMVGPGFVVGVVPSGWFCPSDDPSEPYTKTMYPWDEVGYGKHRPFSEPITSDKYPLKVSSPSRRFGDYVPGEWTVTNEQNVGIRADMFSATVMGGGSYVRVTRIDDEVRLRSTNLTIWTDFEVRRTFNDDGYISSEEYECAYQSERMGDATGSLSLGKTGAGTRCRPRRMKFGGFLAGVGMDIVMRPGGSVAKDPPPSVGPDDVSDHDGDNGVYSDHVSESGKRHVRSAGGISLERYAKIPLVRRVSKASDPAGDHPGGIKFVPNTPFRYSENQHMHPYELYDAIAWEQKNVYRRFDEHGKDWVSQQEPDIGEPPDGANDPAGDREDFSKNANRRAGVFINEDGSVVIRDAFGDEIVMNGGMIRMSTPGSVSVMANRHFSVWANDSAVMKSRDGVAEVCSDGGSAVVRGGKEVHVLGGTDDGPGGAVVVEALGSGVVSNSKGGSILGGGSGGIVLKAMSSEVGIGAKRVAVTSEDQTTLYSGSSDDESGVVQVVAGRVYVSGASQAEIGSGASMVSASESGVRVVSDGSILSLAGGQNISVKNRTEYAIPVWAEIDDQTTKVIEAVEETNESLRRRVSTHYTAQNFREKVFGNEGTVQDYRTTRGQEGFFTSSGHTEFEPFWVLWRNHFSGLSSEPKNWYAASGTFNGGMSFPGFGGKSSTMSVARKSSFVNLDGVYGARRDKLSDSDGGTLSTDGIKSLVL